MNFPCRLGPTAKAHRLVSSETHCFRILSPSLSRKQLLSRGGCPNCLTLPAVETSQPRAEVWAPSEEVQLVSHSSFPAPKAGSFSSDYSSYSEEIRIRGVEVRPDQSATLTTVANLFQEVAGNHAVGMWGRTDMGFANLPSMKDLIFVMTRLQIRMLKYPKWGDMVKVETYFSEDGRLAVRRDWKMTDASSGMVLGGGTSTWVTINTASRKLSKLPEDLKSRFMRLSPQQPRHFVDTKETKRRLPEIDETAKVAGPAFVPRRSDMDMNGHINNVKYLDWALETVPDMVYDSMLLYEVEIDFKAECKAGDEVQSVCVPLTAIACDSMGSSKNAVPAAPGQQQGTPSTPALNSSEPVNGNQPGAHLSAASLPGGAQYLHSLLKIAEAGKSELVRCRTTWLPS